MYTIHKHCRACGYGYDNHPPGIKVYATSERLIPVFDLGVHPLANDFQSDEGEHAGFAPLSVLFCPRCTLAQLSTTVSPDVLYRNYSYVTSKSDMMRDHFKSLWSKMSEDFKINSMVEIGSNDGDMLKFAFDNGASAVGIDPADNLVDIARRRYPMTSSICGKFDVESAKLAKDLVPSPDIVLARHVFCHIDDWIGFFKAIDVLAEENTRIVIEAPYAMKMVSNCEFDTIYHEHLSYLTLRAIDALLDRTPFKIHKIAHFNIHGGTVAIIIQRRDERHSDDKATRIEIEKECIDLKAWERFRECSLALIGDLKSSVARITSEGKTVCGFGASAKSTVWMRMCDFSRKQVGFITDNTPQKQWKLSPGTDIPILDQGALLREMPDYAIMFCWNYAQEVIRSQSSYINKGGHFIVPIPKLQIV